ncbi:MAG: (2Fe-2S) ferredoxin domain-containing protein [Bacteroidetes bacterium]|nr:(2Fe-2S) ferredoxin domain-containing protein [Bacteroidota bacterium]MBU1423679.1 (2Fe-2S) ferredoxin domain-containing protein [Bacteroidota bacterium]MBU2471588.1 (2Fe-2S) ferredoxin domain-containing protein [Bacteroidota bacterium]MBU2636226.1 (2Fe-2S) ferredoxin domain-containing protein [Bacteroidota bacterium]
MAKLKIEDLDKITEDVRRKMTIREGGGNVKITVHMGTCGIAAGARTVMSVFLKEIETHNVKDVIITTSGCAGLCSKEPMATVEFGDQAPVKYIELNENKVKKIFDDHVLKGKFVTEYALSIGSERIQ